MRDAITSVWPHPIPRSPTTSSAGIVTEHASSERWHDGATVPRRECSVPVSSPTIWGNPENAQRARLRRFVESVAETSASKSEEGDGQRNRHLLAVSFRILNRPSEKRAECAQECAQTAVPK